MSLLPDLGQDAQVWERDHGGEQRPSTAPRLIDEAPAGIDAATWFVGVLTNERRTIPVP